MITKLRLRNYRNHVDTEIPLSPLTCFIGPAGGGKSNVFKALELLRTTLWGSPKEYFGPGLQEFEWVRSRWAGEDDTIGIGVDIAGFRGYEGEKASYTMDIGAGPVIARERLVRHVVGEGAEPQVIFDTAQGVRITDPPQPEYEEDSSQLRLAYARAWYTGADGRGSDAQGFAHALARHLEEYWTYHLHATELREPGRANGLGKHLFGGGQLAPFLAALRNEAGTRGRFDGIQEQMRELLPNLREILLSPESDGRLSVSFRFDGHRGIIPAHDLSDGTLYTLGLLCVTEQPHPPCLVAIEEPETGINPRRLKWLFERFADLAEPDDGHGTQVLLSTHAPYLLDFFRDTPEAVCIIDAPDGRAKVRTLDQVLFENPELPDGVSLGAEWHMGFFEGWSE